MPRVARCMVVLALAAPASLAASPDETAVDTLARAALRDWRVPGVAVAVVRDDAVVYLKGHGVRDLGTQAPVTPDTLFPLASCTKAFATTAMALLVDEKRLRWDDPVRKHLPSFRLGDPHADADVRLVDLVTHRTGLRSHDMLWYRAPWSQEEVIRRAGRLPLDFPFRTTFQYQSTMFTAAGRAVAAASGEPWADFTRKRLLDPLGMKGAVFTTTDADKLTDRASPHRRRDGRTDVIPFYPMEAPDAAGSLHAGARDLAQWLRFHLAEGVIGGRRLVTAASLRETYKPQIVLRLEGATRDLNPETYLMSYGMGWLVHDYRGHGLLSHAGLIDGFRAQVTLVPRARVGFVLLCNLHQTRMNLALSNALVDLLLGLPRKDWNAYFLGVVKKEEEATRERLRRLEARPNHPPSLRPADYAGPYEHPAYGTARVSAKDGGLVLDWGSFTMPLRTLAGETFLTSHEHLGGTEVEFVVTGRRVTAVKIGDPVGVEFKRN